MLNMIPEYYLPEILITLNKRKCLVGIACEGRLIQLRPVDSSVETGQLFWPWKCPKRFSDLPGIPAYTLLAIGW